MKNEFDHDIDIREKVIKQIFIIHKNIINNAVKILEKENFSKTEIMILFMVKKKQYKATDLAKEIGISGSTLTGVVDRLVERGYLKRIRDKKDRRIVLIESDELLKEKVDKVYKKVLTIMKDSEMILADEWWEGLSYNLKIIDEVLEEKKLELE